MKLNTSNSITLDPRRFERALVLAGGREYVRQRYPHTRTGRLTFGCSQPTWAKILRRIQHGQPIHRTTVAAICIALNVESLDNLLPKPIERTVLADTDTALGVEPLDVELGKPVSATEQLLLDEAEKLMLPPARRAPWEPEPELSFGLPEAVPVQPSGSDDLGLLLADSDVENYCP